MTSLNLDDDILDRIKDFIQNGNNNQQLEITISKSNISIKDYLNEISHITVSKNTFSNCSLCEDQISPKKIIRTIKKCNHSFHKKCFDNLFKNKILENNVVNEISNYCPICNGSLKK